MTRRTFLAMLGGLAGIAVERKNTQHITWRVYWTHLRDSKYAVTVYLYQENEPNIPSLIFTNECGEYRAWQLKRICEEDTLSEARSVRDMPWCIRSELRTMKYGVEVILSHDQ